MLNNDEQLNLYESMLLIRKAEETIADLRRDGEIGTPCHLYIGQEAIAVGVCSVLIDSDTIWGGHRSHGHYLAKGGNINAFMAEVFGKKYGCVCGRGGSMHLASPEHGILGTVPIVAATIPIAVGAAWAAKLKKNDEVAVAFFGDGATEEGHFYESMNLASKYNLPIIFVCENNLQASHMHITERRQNIKLDSLGDAFAMSSYRVDGNDVLAVREIASTVVSRAREGGGPSFVECMSYRWRGHVDWREDDDVGLKRSDDLLAWKSKCPIALLCKQLFSQGVSQGQFDDISEKVQNIVSEAVEFARSSPYPEPETLMEKVFI